MAKAGHWGETLRRLWKLGKRKSGELLKCFFAPDPASTGDGCLCQRKNGCGNSFTELPVFLSAGMSLKQNILVKENANMKMNTTKRMLAVLLCIVLIAAMALITTGCAENADPTGGSTGAPKVMGTGSTVFQFIAVDLEGNQSLFEIHTDEETVGAALVALELIAGDPGDYGLYVKTVNGVTLDWDTHGKYWALYIGDEYSLTGVDSVAITAGVTYTMKPQ